MRTPAWCVFLLVGACVTVAAYLALAPAPRGEALTAGDVRRARQRAPRVAYRAGDLGAANRVLNEHLATHPNITLRSCAAFSVAELRAVLRQLLPRAAPELQALYAPTDGRRARCPSRTIE